MKIAIWIVVFAIGLFVAYNLWSMFAYYRGIFSVEHYREVALVLEKLRTQAELHPSSDGEGMVPGEDPRTAFTSRDLVLSYTISPEGGLYVHHLSVSTPQRGKTTIAAGETFASFFAWRLGVKPADCTAFLGVHSFHLEFAISEEDQRAFMDRSLVLLREIDLGTIREEALRMRRQIEFFDAREQIEADLEQEESGTL